MKRSIAAVVVCLFTTAAWAADREISMKAGERRSFKLPGIAQIAVDDAQVVEGVGKGDSVDVEARHEGTARIMVLLKSDQWVTFRIKVGPGDVPSGPIAEELPGEGEVLRLRLGERRAFETPGIAKMPLNTGGTFDAKVTGKQLELRGLTPGRAMLELVLTGGKHLMVPVVVEPEAVQEVQVAARRADLLAGEVVNVPENGEQLVKVPDLESVSVEDDDVAEVRIVGDGRVVVRGINEGDTRVLVRRAGRVYAYPVNVTAPPE
jgi:hypothetical protein